MTQKTAHFTALEGLRAWLALWVAVGHGLQTSGILKLSGAASLLLSGNTAVHVFIILSGFVISHLLICKHETYQEYITRRFYRLFPSYLLACILGYGAMHLWGDVVTLVPWGANSYWHDYRESVEEIVNQSRNNFLPHALLHLTMLHGVVPTEILHRASMTFLPAAWSVSLEWQFYLIAPFVIATVRLNKTAALITFAVTVILIALFREGVFGKFPIGSFILHGAPYFGIGILSRLWIFPRQSFSSSISGAFLLLFVLASFFGHRYLGAVVWFAFFTVFCLPRNWRVRKYALAPVENKAAVTIGRASYSLYLLHRPIQVAFAWVFINQGLSEQPQILISQLIAVFIAILIAWQSWKHIEVPWQNKGGLIAGKFKRRCTA